MKIITEIRSTLKTIKQRINEQNPLIIELKQKIIKNSPVWIALLLTRQFELDYLAIQQDYIRTIDPVQVLEHLDESPLNPALYNTTTKKEWFEECVCWLLNVRMLSLQDGLNSISSDSTERLAIVFLSTRGASRLNFACCKH